MKSLSRRNVFKVAGLAGLGALSAPAVLRGSAQAAEEVAMQPPPSGIDYKRFRLGSFEITILSDGHRRVPDPHAIFGIDQEKAAVEKLAADNFLPTDVMQFTFAPVLVNTGSDLIIFDTGNGEPGRAGGAGLALESLKASGYRPDDVTMIALTHMHGDHIGGIVEGGKPAMPNARFVSHQVEYDFWTSDKLNGTKAEGNHKQVMTNVAPFRDKFTFVKEGDTVVPGITAHEAFGHTPGHTVYRIESEGRTLMITGDTSNHYVLSLQRPDWHVSFDMDKPTATASRKKVFDMIAAEKVPFVGYHMPFPAAGYVSKMDEGGYRFVPVTYQFAV